MPDEPRTGYYVQTHDRPKFVSGFTEEDFDMVFSLMRRELCDESATVH